MKRIITLTTDYGLKDHYVGAMKGVILAINPDVLIVDITHKIPPQDIFKGAFILRKFYRYFSRGTIHVVVVDPGVGGGRKPIVLEADENIFIGPDNGVFTFVYRESVSVRAFEILNPKYILPDVSSTFHGRDIFAPAAAHVSLGISIEDLGKNVKNPVTISFKKPKVQEDGVIGEVIYIDQFGNLITNISADLIKPRSRIYICEKIINSISKSYADVPKGGLLASFGSSGFLEISVNQGRASDVINSTEKGSERANRMPEVRVISNPK